MRPDMQSQSPRENADGAKGNQHDAVASAAASASEADFPALILARRYRLPLPVARFVARLAFLGGRLS